MSCGRRLHLGDPKRSKTYCEGCDKKQKKRLTARHNECGGCGFILCAACMGPDREACLDCTRRKKRPAPIIDECNECGGTGRVQVCCGSCGDRLTEANVSEDPEWCLNCFDEAERDAAS